MLNRQNSYKRRRQLPLTHCIELWCIFQIKVLIRFFLYTLFYGINTVILDSTLCKLIQLLIAYTLRNLVCIIQWYFNVYQWNRWISALRRRAFFSFNKYEWAKAADWSWNYYSLSAENFSSTCIVWIAVEQITACWKSLKIFKWYLLPCKYVLVCTKT